MYLIVDVGSMAQAMYNVWLEKPRFDEAERIYQEHMQKMKTGGCSMDRVCTSSRDHQTTVSILKMFSMFCIFVFLLCDSLL